MNSAIAVHLSTSLVRVGVGLDAEGLPWYDRTIFVDADGKRMKDRTGHFRRRTLRGKDIA